MTVTFASGYWFVVDESRGYWGSDRLQRGALSCSGCMVLPGRQLENV